MEEKKVSIQKSIIWNSAGSMVYLITQWLISVLAVSYTHLMFIFADLCGFNDVLIKCAANVLVIILNYVASKLVIFRHKG